MNQFENQLKDICGKSNIRKRKENCLALKFSVIGPWLYSARSGKEFTKCLANVVPFTLHPLSQRRAGEQFKESNIDHSEWVPWVWFHADTRRLSRVLNRQWNLQIMS